MLIVAYTRASVVLDVLHSDMLQNKHFHRHLMYSMTSVVVLFAYSNNISILKLCLCSCRELSVHTKSLSFTASLAQDKSSLVVETTTLLLNGIEL